MGWFTDNEYVQDYNMNLKKLSKMLRYNIDEYIGPHNFKYTTVELYELIRDLYNELNIKKERSELKMKTNYEKTMSLKKEYEDLKKQLETIKKNMLRVKQKAKDELNWILDEEIE